MKILLLSLALLQVIGLSHDMQVAVFKIYQENDKIFLQIHLETDDLETELTVSKEDLSSEVLINYLRAETAFFINGKKQQLNILESKFSDKHLVIDLQFSGSFQAIDNLMISNSCLLGIEDQSNIIELRLYNQERDFLMNKHRTMIDVQL